MSTAVILQIVPQLRTLLNVQSDELFPFHHYRVASITKLSNFEMDVTKNVLPYKFQQVDGEINYSKMCQNFLI